MLIVNADDLGASPRVNDAILRCFDAGAITSASAMAWMHGSGKAARAARAAGLPVGLHVNLTLAYDDLGAPGEVVARQAAAAPLFDGGRDLASAPTPAQEAAVRGAIADQLERHRAQFGEPTHVDGHHHVHTHPTVMDLLPAGYPVRSVLRLPRHAADPPTALEERLHARFEAPSLTLAFEHLHPDLGGRGFDLLEHAGWRDIEVVVHPGQERDLQALLSPAWRELMARLPLAEPARPR